MVLLMGLTQDRLRQEAETDYSGKRTPDRKVNEAKSQVQTTLK
jgi:hypothetical protein